MKSRLYTGWVTHERVRPARNTFRYPIYYLGVDLDELDQLDATLKCFSHNRANIVSLWDRDHGPRDGTRLRPWIDALASAVGVDLAGGRVMLLTFPRVLGARFYPVSFWYCFGASGVLLAVLAEVHNTFGDRHNYLLHNGGQDFEFGAQLHMAKAFYVSPFVQRENVEYEFAFSEPAEEITVSIRDIVEGSFMLSAAIDVHARDLTDRALVSTVIAHGPISVVGLLRIHWQALRLAFKRVPFFPHTPPPAEETSLWQIQ